MRRNWMAVAVTMLAVGAMVFLAVAQAGERGGRAGGGRAGGGRAGGGRPGGGGMAFGGRFTGGGMLPDYTARIPDLSADQRKQIATLREQTMAKIRELQEQMNAQIKHRILTPEQAKLMEEAQRRVTHRGPGGITMTDAQKKIMDDARAQAAKVEGREAKMQIMRDAYEKIQASYTDEQKKQSAERRKRFEEMRNRGRGARGGAREGGGEGGRARQRPE